MIGLPGLIGEFLQVHVRPNKIDTLVVTAISTFLLRDQANELPLELHEVLGLNRGGHVEELLVFPVALQLL